MSQVSELRKLQEIDDLIARLRAEHDEVERWLAGDDELVAARKDLADAEAVAAPLRVEEKRLSDTIQSLTEKIEHEDKKLYSGTIKNPKELTDLQAEVESLKKQRMNLEDQMLEVEVQLEPATATLNAASEIVKSMEAGRAANLPGWKQSAAKLVKELTAAERQRSEQQSAVAASALALYERVRQRRAGWAVAAVNGTTCAACRVSMPDSVRKQLFKPDQLVQCPNCERILYLG